MKKPQNIAIVYQVGICNVFEITAKGERIRLLQGAFVCCEWFARGMQAAGCSISIWSCNRAGDIASAEWTPDLEDCPFWESAFPPKEGLA